MSMEEATVFAMSQIIKPTKLKASVFLVVTVVLLVTVAVVISVRTWSNYTYARKIFMDDCTRTTCKKPHEARRPHD